MAAYPRIYFACHLEHREDPVTRDVISAHQGSILDHLDAVEPMGLLDLAKHMGVTASTMSLTVDRLERVDAARPSDRLIAEALATWHSPRRSGTSAPSVLPGRIHVSFQSP